MGQSSISMLNKVGYSMFWGSMWDNKIIYNRLLKEDIFIDKFFDFIFTDNLSVNIFNIKKINANKHVKSLNFGFNVSNKSSLYLYKYLKNSNKVKYFNSKVWVLKYQNWVIIYNFLYLQQFYKYIKKRKEITLKFSYNNFSYFSNLSNSFNKKLITSYSLYNKNKKKVFF